MPMELVIVVPILAALGLGLFVHSTLSARTRRGPARRSRDANDSSTVAYADGSSVPGHTHNHHHHGNDAATQSDADSSSGDSGGGGGGDDGGGGDGGGGD